MIFLDISYYPKCPLKNIDASYVDLRSTIELHFKHNIFYYLNTSFVVFVRIIKILGFN